MSFLPQVISWRDPPPPQRPQTTQGQDDTTKGWRDEGPMKPHPFHPPHGRFLIIFDPPPSPPCFTWVFYMGGFSFSLFLLLHFLAFWVGFILFSLISLTLCILHGAGLFSLIFSLFPPPPCICMDCVLFCIVICCPLPRILYRMRGWL